MVRHRVRGWGGRGNLLCSVVEDVEEKVQVAKAVTAWATGAEASYAAVHVGWLAAPCVAALFCMYDSTFVLCHVHHVSRRSRRCSGGGARTPCKDC